ncbi:MAG: hypothetical protein GEU82_15535 [Luteitalea sp.]|nr:hypothetical protein [Luteitalea sp.]
MSWSPSAPAPAFTCHRWLTSSFSKMWRALVCRSVALALLCAALAGAAPAAASFIDPRLGFRVLSTEHFVIYFHQGEDAAAARLSAIAEDAWHRVSASLASPAPRRTHVILADQTDLANGWASPLPRNTIFVSAAAPGGSEFIGRSDDWMRMVFIHEFTHIAHLDRSEGWARVFRGLFGRTPLAFPNLFLPAWQIEGLASWQESALTGQGRLHAGDFRLIEREAARAGRLEPLDRVNGGLTDWPDGLGAYAYGLGFHEYLADRFGAASLGQLAKETAGSAPFLGSRAFRTVYEQSLGSLWNEYRNHLAAHRAIGGPALRQDGAATMADATRITRDGHLASGPRFAPACSGCAGTIVYSLRHPSGFPALRSVTLDGTGSRRLADRFLGSTLGVSVNVIVFDQQEWRRNASLYSDLYALDRHTGAVQPLTSEARVQDPDLSPDGRTIVGVREHRGRRDLVLLSLGPGAGRGASVPDVSPDAPPTLGATARWTAGSVTTLVSEPETQFNTPRWSPDGQSVAVARQRLGALSEIVVVDVSSGAARTIASHPAARIVTPAWRPDGRAIVAAADYDEGPFDLYEFPAEGSPIPGRRLTALPGGATSPDVSADGNTIVFVGYTVDGFDLFTIAYPHSASGGIAPGVQEPPAAETTTAIVPDLLIAAGADPYSPLPTLMPTSWNPILETGSDQLRAGIGIGGADVLARHAYATWATWLLDAPSDAVSPDAARPDWQLRYVYDRWRPTFFVSASSATAFGAGPPDDAGRPTSATLRADDIEGGVLLPFRQVRATHRLAASILRITDRYTFADRLESRTRHAVRGGWATSTARMFGYSVSQEDGVSVGVTAEHAGFGSAESSRATTITADARAYLGGAAPHHVLALRAAGGFSLGRQNGGRTFHLGGSRASRDVVDFGRQAISLLRGFPSDAFAGTRVALLNGDYRFPIARPQRGIGTFPLMLHSLHAAVFADAGHAWAHRFTVRDAKIAAGGELSADIVAAYFVRLTVTAGAAWGHDGADVASGNTVYLRIGRAF